MYCIRDGYVSRDDVRYFDDTQNADKYQDGVYAHAVSVAPGLGDAVLDVGCGSCYKLVKYFPDSVCHGVDLPQTVRAVRSNRMPVVLHQTAASGCFAPIDAICFGLVICADVIEHLLRPDTLIGWLWGLRWNVLVISTPDRSRLVAQGWCDDNGPPRNWAHIREWAESEWMAYMSESFPCDVFLARHHINGTHTLVTTVVREA